MLGVNLTLEKTPFMAALDTKLDTQLSHSYLQIYTGQNTKLFYKEGFLIKLYRQRLCVLSSAFRKDDIVLLTRGWLRLEIRSLKLGAIITSELSCQ